MGYRILNRYGNLVAGDDSLDAAVKAAADHEEGWVEDETGALLYDSPAHIEAMRKAEEAQQ